MVGVPKNKLESFINQIIFDIGMIVVSNKIEL